MTNSDQRFFYWFLLGATGAILIAAGGDTLNGLTLIGVLAAAAGVRGILAESDPEKQ